MANTYTKFSVSLHNLYQEKNEKVANFNRKGRPK